MIISISWTETGALRFHPIFRRHSSLLLLLWLPAVPPLPPHWVFPTTRWRRVSCSGNSVCRTRCWLSEVLWLFRRLPGASGPTARVFYRPSGLGTGSGSWEKEKYVKTKISSMSSCWNRSGRTHLPPHYGYLFVELSSVETRVFLRDTVNNTYKLECSQPQTWVILISISHFPLFKFLLQLSQSVFFWHDYHFILHKDLAEYLIRVPPYLE